MSRFPLCLIILLFLNTGCLDPPSPAVYDDRTEEDLPDQEAWDTTIYLIENDRQRIVVTAAHRLHYPKSRQTIMDRGLRVAFYDEHGDTVSTLTADRGVIDEESQDMSAFGRVVITSIAHGTLETDSIRWIEDTNRIYTDAPVRISTAKEVITGIGFEADPDLKRWTIRRNVRGRLDRKDELKERIEEPE